MGDLLLPLALQEGTFAELQRRSILIARAASADNHIASGTIYDITKVFVTADRDFAEAWSVLMPPPELKDRDVLEYLTKTAAVGAGGGVLGVLVPFPTPRHPSRPVGVRWK